MNENARQIICLVVLVTLALILLFTFRVVHASPRVLYVAQNGMASGDCESWTNACTWQYALSIAVSGDEVWVKKGLYYPGTNVTDTFTLKSGVAIYGGFAGIETQRDQRNWRINATVLSGDVDRNDFTDSNGVVTSTLYIKGVNAYHVISTTNINNAILDGFIITAGRARDSLSDDYGGGMYNRSSSLTLRNLIFSGNSGYIGGGISNVESILQIEDVTFSGNGGFLGGGMYNKASSLIISGVIFSSNSADQGGGMYNYEGTTLTMTNVLFSNNGGFKGGGIYNWNASLTLINAVFNGNNAHDGGGIYNRGSLTVINAVLNGNRANNEGGGIYNWSDTTLVNATLSGNSAGFTGGGIYNLVGNMRLTNVIVWGNVARDGANIYYYATAPDISYSDVQGCGGSGLNWRSSCGIDKGYNIDADPLFVSVASGDLHLLPGSPCIDNGDNAAIPADVTLDLDGNPRVVDSNDDGNAIVDMGAYEAPRFKKIYLPLVLRGVL